MRNTSRTILHRSAREEILDEVAMAIFEVIKANDLTFTEADDVLRECEYLIKERRIR